MRAVISTEADDGFQHFHDAADDSRASEFRHPVEDLEPLPESNSAEWGLALSMLFGWLTEPYFRPVNAKGGGRRTHCYVCPRKLGLRTAALIYSLRPDLLPGETAVSLSNKLGITKQAFAKHVRSFREKFKLRTRVMRSDPARAKMKAAMLKSWEKRKAFIKSNASRF